MNDIKHIINIKIKSQNGIINRYIIWIICLIMFPLILFSEIIRMYKKMVTKGYIFNFTVEDIIYFIIGIVLINILYKVFNKNRIHNKLKLILINIICIVSFFFGILVRSLCAGSTLID